jgi:hypothetical protein
MTGIVDEPVVRIGFPWWMRPFLWRDVIALTIGRRVWISPRAAGDVEPLLRHEMVHVRQMSELGVLPFLWKYARHYLRNRRRGMGHHEAYLAIPFEVEAFAAERADRL